MGIRGGWLLASMILLFGAAAQAKDTPCTYGQNCLCDRLKKTSDPLYNPSVIFCEDFENPVLNNGDNYQPGVDGLADGWSRKYGPGPGDCLDLKYPSGTGQRDEGSEGTNAHSCINIVQEGACEVGTDCVFEGTSALAFRYRPNHTGGIMGGTKFIGGPTTNFGVTMLWKVTPNFVSPHDPGGNGPGAKSDEYGVSDSCILGCSTFNAGAGAQAYPFAGVTKPMTGRANPTILRGVGEQGDDGYRFAPTTTDYQQSRDWPKGTWACYQTKWTGWGTKSASMTYWLNGREIIKMTNYDMTTMVNNQGGVGGFSWNDYYNGADGTGSGYTGSSLAYRIEDNVVVTNGDPVSCDAVGFTGAASAGDPSGGTTTTLGTPGRPMFTP
jgi:hypothetical protein